MRKAALGAVPKAASEAVPPAAAEAVAQVPSGALPKVASGVEQQAASGAVHEASGGAETAAASQVAPGKQSDTGALRGAALGAEARADDKTTLHFRTWWQGLFPSAPKPASAPCWTVTPAELANVRRVSKGIAGIAFAPKAGRRSKCRVCNDFIQHGVVRFTYWWAVNHPQGYVHASCLRGTALEDEAILQDLRLLAVPSGELQDCVHDWMDTLMCGLGP